MGLKKHVRFDWAIKLLLGQRDNFSRKEVLEIVNMSEKERREYQRFGEVLSDRASQALTIKVELEMAIEKTKKDMIINLLKLGNLPLDQIAQVSDTSVEFVEEIKKKM